MSDIFVSYASEDRPHARAIVAALEATGCSVWWDHHLSLGERFDRRIEQEVAQCRCLVVLWSSHSTRSDWVRAEAQEALEQNKLVQVLLDDNRPPLLFRQQHAFRINDEPDLSILAAATAAVVERAAAPGSPQGQSLWLIGHTDYTDAAMDLEGSLEAVFEIALEHLPDVYLYPRESAGTGDARTLAREEGLDFLLASKLRKTRSGFVIVATVERIRDGAATTFECDAESLEGLPRRAGELINSMLQDLGLDARLDPNRIASLDLGALQEDLLGVEAQAAHHHEQALAHFDAAIARDSTLWRAYVGKTISFDSLGRISESRDSIAHALRYLDLCSEREAHRLQYMYYVYYSENFERALQHAQAITALSPLDVPALNNQALARCNLLDFTGAVVTCARAADLQPNEPFYKANLALYCMYAGDFERARSTAMEALAREPGMLDAHRALCGSLAAMGDARGSRKHLEVLKTFGDSHAAALIDADLHMADSADERAREVLTAALELTSEDGGELLLANNRLMMAEIELNAGNRPHCDEYLVAAMTGCSDSRVLANAAVLAARSGNQAILRDVEEQLGRRLDRRSNAYADMARALREQLDGHFAKAEPLFAAALDAADCWVIRFALARLYLRLEMPLESTIELKRCVSRSGEAVTAYVDRLPTYRYLVDARRHLNAVNHHALDDRAIR